VVFSKRGKRENAKKDGKAEMGRNGGGEMRRNVLKCRIHAVESGASPHKYKPESEMQTA
jgi:hypothetical protein